MAKIYKAPSWASELRGRELGDKIVGEERRSMTFMPDRAVAAAAGLVDQHCRFLKRVFDAMRLSQGLEPKPEYDAVLLWEQFHDGQVNSLASLNGFSVKHATHTHDQARIDTLEQTTRPTRQMSPEESQQPERGRRNWFGRKP